MFESGCFPRESSRFFHVFTGRKNIPPDKTDILLLNTFYIRAYY